MLQQCSPQLNSTFLSYTNPQQKSASILINPTENEELITLKVPLFFLTHKFVRSCLSKISCNSRTWILKKEKYNNLVSVSLTI